MMLVRTFSRLRHDPRARALKGLVLLARGLAFAGRRFVCPCCGWHVRAFVGPWSLRSQPTGYCPRCNAKARHRRLWLYLQSHLLADAVGSPEAASSEPGTAPGRPRDATLPKAPRAAPRLIDVAPWPALARRTQSLERLRYVGVDLEARGPHVSVRGNVAALPFADGRFDIVICQHVLEHVEDDTRALAELFRVTAPGGHALVSVPIRLDRPTYEDPSVVTPEDRARLFGERDHVRFYGRDLAARLTAAGFGVELDLAGSVPAHVRERHGLRTDEHIFHCRKPVQPAHEPASRAATAGLAVAGPRAECKTQI